MNEIASKVAMNWVPGTRKIVEGEEQRGPESGD